MNSELYHHGIQGQKWGIRNGPPYPLGSGNKEKTKMHNDDARAFISQYNGIFYKDILKKKKEYDELVKNKLDNLFLSDEEKEINRNIEMSRKNGEFNKIEGEHDYKSDIKNVNPNYGSENAEYSSNCALCAITYDMRRRGFDVTANPSKTGRIIDNIAKTYDSNFEDYNRVSSSSQLIKKISEMPDDSRGFINCTTGPEGLYHVLVFEKNGNDLMIIDPQDATIYDSKSAFDSLVINAKTTKDYFYFRTDDKNPNMDLIYDACTNRKR